MVTFFLIVIGALVVVGLGFLVMNSGMRVGRHGQSGRTAVDKQHQPKPESGRGTGID
jgi:hypothetical protein